MPSKKKTKKITYNYIDKNNKKITKKETLERIKKLRIPPAYKNVIISESPNSDIQAIGVDDKGRKQYIYHSNFIKKKQTEKYKNIIKLGDHIDNIIKDTEKIINKNYKKPIKSWEQPTTNLALLMYLLYHCNFRIGNIKYVKEYNSYGALTLLPKHLNFKGNYLDIKFIGKKGVINNSTINNKKVIYLLKELKNNANTYIFEYNNTLMNKTYVSEYLKQYDPLITPKMFRTWYANYYFLETIKKDINKNMDELITICNYKTKIKSYIKKCCEYVAEKLNNTATISKKSYLDSEIIDIFVNNPCHFINFLNNNNKLSNNDLLIKIMKKIK